MNETDFKIIDKMIADAWNDNNAFCDKMKSYFSTYFSHEKEIAKRCEGRKR